MSKSTLLKLGSIRPQVNRYYSYLFTRWRYQSTFVVYFIMFVISSGILMLLTDQGMKVVMFYLIESGILAGVCTFLQMSYFRKRWRHESPLTQNDIAVLINHGKELIKNHGKFLSWEQLCMFASDDKSLFIPAKLEDQRAFRKRYSPEHILAGILVAMVHEGGWRSIPDEAINATYHYPAMYRPFSAFY